MDGPAPQTHLYQRVLGARFARLPPRVQRLHQPGPHFEARGEAQVMRGDSSAARILADTMRLPPAAEKMPLHFSIDTVDGVEHWRRDFGGHVFTSQMWEENGVLCERTGIARLRYELELDHGVMRMELRGFKSAGIPVPRLLWPRVATAESERAGRYCFDVRASMPGVGLVIRYRGWLEV